MYRIATMKAIVILVTIASLALAAPSQDDSPSPPPQPFLEPSTEPCVFSIANKTETPVQARIREDCIGSLAWCFWRWYEIEAGSPITSADECLRSRGRDPSAITIPHIVNATAYARLWRHLEIAVKAYGRYSVVMLFMELSFGDGADQPDWPGTVQIQSLEATNERRRVLAEHSFKRVKYYAGWAFDAAFVPQATERLERSWRRITYRWGRVLQRGLELDEEMHDFRDWISLKTLRRWAPSDMQESAGHDVWIPGPFRKGRGFRKDWMNGIA